MLYIDLFKCFGQVQWDMQRDIKWGRLDAAWLTDEQALTIEMNAITEGAALPTTEMFHPSASCTTCRACSTRRCSP